MNQERSGGLNILYVGTLPPHTGGSAVLAGDVLTGLSHMGHRIRAIGPITPEILREGDDFARTHPEIEVTRFLVPYFEVAPDVEPPNGYREAEGEQIGAAMQAAIAHDRPGVAIIGRESFVWHVPEIAKANAIPTVQLLQGGIIEGIVSGTIPEARANEILNRLRGVDLLVSVAKHSAVTLEGLGVGPVEVIENTVDDQMFAPAPKSEALLRELAIGEDDIVVAHVSNLKALKRPLDLVAAAREALRHDGRLVFVVVGDGVLREAMEEACRRDGMTERFRFVGWVDRARIPDYLNLADVVVMPSESEARALVYLETQACGRVLLASDIPSAREAIVDGETGLLFAKGDVADLTAKLLEATGNSSLRAHIGRRAREVALTRPLDDLVRAYDALLRRVEG